MYRSARLELRLTETEVRMLDKIRGSVSRSAWIRNQILRVHSTQIGPVIAPDVSFRDDPHA